MNIRIDSTIRVQIETSVCRRAGVHRVAIALGKKLRARRGCREQANIAAIAVTLSNQRLPIGIG
jgi:hypothetical protein